jgi:hypothetical protein
MDRFRSSEALCDTRHDVLARHSSTFDIAEVSWDGVTSEEPCPICGCDTGCRRHVIDAFVCCVRRPSDWPLTNGAWLHRVLTSKKAATHGPP